MVGSGIWRLVNYGPLATLRYLVSRSKSPSETTNALINISLEELVNKLHLPDLDVESLQNDNSRYLKDLRSKMLTKKNARLKPVLSHDVTIARLLLLDVFIRNLKYECVIETGTQHGVSAYVMAQVINEIPNPPRLITYDVASTELISEEKVVEYVKLNSPVRKNFITQTKKLQGQKILFFHDSDHSYENMAFEFNFAWNELQVDTIISDDIDGNSAFQDFVFKNNVHGFRIKLDDGPALGVVSRELT
jgi:hypothetical protein